MTKSPSRTFCPDEVEDPAEIAWASLENAIGNQLRQEIADLYVAQTQVKLFLIEIERIEISSETAITYAHQNRLDVMNSKAIVMDAFRRVEVAADALESDLDVSGQVNVGSDPNSNSPFKLDSANNRYTLGLQLDGPLNRLNERNAYRATQIAYQRASRDYIASKDRVANEVRQIPPSAGTQSTQFPDRSSTGCRGDAASRPGADRVAAKYRIERQRDIDSVASARRHAGRQEQFDLQLGRLPRSENETVRRIGNALPR